MKMYIMVNKDILTDSQCAVQAAHVVSEYMYYNHDNPNVKDWIENHVTKVILSGDSEKIDFLEWLHNDLGLSYRIFKETDLNGAVTAIACEPTNNYKLYKTFKLL